jgi:alkanesulfonate monooxygenase SsuD/methylene tetrahydromethanopterin reductase-like flavin-dependent oxidoreductase (luciferase family)
LAASLGLPFAIADFFGNAGDIGPRVAEIYRRQFKPSEYLASPRVNVAVHVVCAPTDEEARFIASSTRLLIAHIRTGGLRAPLPSPEEAVQQAQDPRVEAILTSFTRHFIQGSPTTVRARLIDVADRYQADELSITTNCYYFEHRLRSFELVAQCLQSP